MSSGASSRAGRAFALALPAVAFLAFVVAPLLVLGELAGPFELADYERAAVARAWSRGLLLALGVATLSAALAVPLARAASPLALLGLLLVSRSHLAMGVLALGLAPGPGAATLTLVLDSLPLAALLVGLRLRTRPQARIDAAADLGASWLERAWTFELPHLAPALLAAWSWALLQGLGDVVAFELAGGGHSYTPGLLIRDALLREQAGARALAGVLGILVVALPCAWMVAGELEGFEAHARRGELAPRSTAPLRARWSGDAALGWALFLVMLAAPAALLLGEHPAGLTARDLELARLGARSLGLAAGVGALASALAFGLALAPRLARPRLAAAALLTPLALPPAISGLLTLTAGARLGLGPGPTLTALALLGPTLPLAYLCARPLVAGLPPQLLELARDLGASARERLLRVWLPLGLPAILVAFAAAFAWILGQAALPSFTSGPGGDTLSVALTILARGGALPLVRRWAALSILAPLGLALLAKLAITATTRR